MKPEVVDVLIIGGSFSGAATAQLLREKSPDAKVVIVERNRKHERKVGEATVEVSGLFLARYLGVFETLKRDHIPKHGLRFWFTDHHQRKLNEMAEIGPRQTPPPISFQIDRAKLDESILEKAQEAGAQLLRSHRVVSVEQAWPLNRVEVEGPDGETRTFEARWVIDASGRQCFMTRRLGHYREVPDHPTAAAWGRWKGIGNFPMPDVGARRSWATNHFCGYGYWIWMIPLSGGDTSIGLVYDKRHFDLPAGGKLRERFEKFVTNHDGLRELMQGAEIVDDDFLAYKSLPYTTERYMGRGWAAVGDAAGFLDPIYSPGLDHCSISAFATATLVADQLNGSLDEASLDHSIEVHNGEFVRSYRRSLEALYLDKYELMGDAELMTAAYHFDTGMYYQGIVGPIYNEHEQMRHPPFGTDITPSRMAYRLMRAVRGRLVRIARYRRLTGRYGQRNLDLFEYPRYFHPGVAGFKLIARAARLWLLAEWQMCWWRLWNPRVDLSKPTPLATSSRSR